MHNLQNEYLQPELEAANQEYGYELSPEFEYANEFAQEYQGESNYELSPEFETAYETGNYETELANELMEVSNEAEFFDWIKNTAKKAAGVASGFLDSPTGQQATAVLTDIAQKTLPSAGATAGGFVGQKGGEALGGAVGGYFGVGPVGKKVGGWAGQKLGAWGGQKAGQWAADRFPSFVRFTADTLRNLSKEVAVKGPNVAVKPIVIKAAAKHYPIILKVKGTLQARVVPPLNKESQYEYAGEFGLAGETQGEILNNEGTFNEVTEMELASELLAVSNESELDQFLGKLFKKAVGAAKGFIRSGAGKTLGGILRTVAKKALPLAGGALGSIVPGVGTAIGTALGGAASNLFELELEGLSAEDREFETARAFVRFAGNAARRTASTPGGNPQRSARQSVINAARRYAPGLVVRRRQFFNRYNNADRYDGSDASNGGNWYREGDRIILEGVS